MTAPELSRLRSGVTVAVLTVTGILAVGQNYVVLGLIDSMADGLNVPSSAIAATSTVFGIAYACGFLVSGPLAGRFGAKPVLIVGLACASAATLAAAAPSSLTGEQIVRAVQGFVTASFAPCALVYVAQQFSARLRTLATTALTTAFLASVVVMPLLAGPVGHALGWRGVFIAGAAALATCTVVLGFTLNRGPATFVPMARAFLMLPTVIRRGRMLTLYAAAAAILGSYVALFTALQLSNSAAVAAFPGGLQGLRVATLPALVVVTLTIGLLHNVPARRRATAGFLLAALSATVTAIVDTTPVVAGGVIVFLAAIALTTPALVARIVELSAPAETAAATAWYGAFMFLGSSIGPLIAAPAGHGSLTTATFLVVAVTLIGAVLVSVAKQPQPVRDTTCHRDEEASVAS